MTKGVTFNRASAVLLVLAMAGSVAAQPPTVQQLKSLRLHNGFTLVYRITVQDLRSPAMRAAEMDVERQGIDQAVREGHIPAHQKDQFLTDAERAYGQHRPTERFLITLSARGGELLYRSTRGSNIEEAVTKKAVVLEADKAYEADGKTAGAIYNDGSRVEGVYADENVDRLDFCPLPGVGFPGVDLIQSPVVGERSENGHTIFNGMVPRLGTITGGESPYKPGEIETLLSHGHLKVVSLIVGPAAVPEQRWDIDQHQMFQGHWIGSHMRLSDYTDYEALPAAPGVKTSAVVPADTMDYQMLEARDTPLAASEFELAAVLNKGAQVSDDSGQSTFMFTNDPQGGSLKEQADRARPRATWSPAPQEKR